MVRHKNRWLLVKVELADDIRNNNSNNNHKKAVQQPSSFPSKIEFIIRLRRTVAWCFGIEGQAACDAQVKFCDPDTKLVVVRVPRDACGRIRAALTLLLTRKQMLSLGETTSKSQDFQASVLSVHGSARTTKIALFRLLRKLYRIEMEESRKLFPTDDKLEKKLCRALQEQLALVQNNMN